MLNEKKSHIILQINYGSPQIGREFPQDHFGENFGKIPCQLIFQKPVNYDTFLQLKITNTFYDLYIFDIQILYSITLLIIVGCSTPDWVGNFLPYESKLLWVTVHDFEFNLDNILKFLCEITTVRNRRVRKAY